MHDPWIIPEFTLMRWLRMAAGHTIKTTTWSEDWSWASLTSGEGRGARNWVQSCGQWFDQLWLCNETPMKALDTEAQVSFLVGEHIRCAGRVTHSHSTVRGQRGSAFRTLPALIMCLFIWLVLICILYSQTVIVSIVLSWVLWVVLANYWTWGDHWNFRIYCQ